MSTIEEAREQAHEALGNIWDDGNAAGLDGWVGPGRGAGEVDDEAIRSRDRAIEKCGRALLDATEPRPITDEMVEAAARVMFDAPAGMTGDYTWAEMVGEDPSRADLWRADARAALEAAEEARR